MKVGFVGSGNMAAGLARGWALAREDPNAPEAMLFADAAPGRAEEVAADVDGEALGSNREVADAADLVVLAVKPNVLDDVAGEVAESATPVISILAGTSLERLEAALPEVEIVRVMPNLGAALRQGTFCVSYPEGLGADARTRARDLLALLGDVIEIEEELIDAATALMGCGPGYLALLAEAMVEEGVREGLTEDQALRMIAGPMAATGGLLESQQPDALKKAVASPGGMTEAGLEALEEHDFRGALRAAVDASLARVRG